MPNAAMAAINIKSFTVKRFSALCSQVNFAYPFIFTSTNIIIIKKRYFSNKRLSVSPISLTLLKAARNGLLRSPSFEL